MEVVVVVGILALLLGLGWLPFSRYRARNAVVNAVDVLHGVTDRAVETAKANGHPMPPSLKQAGLTDPALPSAPGADLWVRVRQRFQDNAAPQLVLERPLVRYGEVAFAGQGLGTLDLDADGSLRGVFLEVFSREASGKVVLAVLPVDVNGEMILFETSANGEFRFGLPDFQKSLNVTSQGVVRTQ